MLISAAIKWIYGPAFLPLCLPINALSPYVCVCIFFFFPERVCLCRGRFARSPFEFEKNKNPKLIIEFGLDFKDLRNILRTIMWTAGRNRWDNEGGRGKEKMSDSLINNFFLRHLCGGLLNHAKRLHCTCAESKYFFSSLMFVSSWTIQKNTWNIFHYVHENVYVDYLQWASQISPQWRMTSMPLRPQDTMHACVYLNTPHT